MAGLLKALRALVMLVAGVVATAAAVLLIVYALLRSGFIDDSIDDLVTLLAHKEGDFFVRAEDVSGDLPFHLRVRKVEIGDAEGVWMTIEDAEANWHPFELYHPFDVDPWRIRADNVHVRHLQWTRLPVPTVGDDEPFRWDELIRIVVDHLRVDDLEITGQLLDGATAHFEAEGSGVLGEWDHGFLDLDIARIDAVEGNARIDLKTHGSPVELDGTVTAEEDEGGALARLAAIPDAGAVTLEVRASGPLRDWRGEAEIFASGIGRLDLKAFVTFNAAGPFEAAGTFSPTVAMRERMLFGDGESARILARGAFAPDVELRLDEVRIEARQRELSGHGRFDLATRAGRLEALLHASAPSLAGVFAGDLHGTLELTDAPGDSVPTFGLEVRATGLHLASGKAPALLGDEARLVASGQADLDAGRIDAEKLRINGADLVVEGPFALRKDWGALKTSLRLESSQLRSLEPLFGASVSGKISATVEASAASGWDDFDVVAGARAEGISIREPGWNALLGGDTTAQLSLKGGPDGPAQGSFELHASGIEASGRGSIAEHGDGLAADARLTVDNLAKLSQPARAAISGRLEAGATLRGSMENFSLDATVRGDRFHWESLRFDTLTADVNARSLPDDWHARVTARAGYGGLSASLDAGVSRSADDRIAIRGLALSGPRTEGRADLEVDLDSATASGRVVLASEDLALWRLMTGTALGGAVNLDATLDATPAASQRGGSGVVQRITATAAIRDGTAQIGGNNVSVDLLEATAEGIELGPNPRGQAMVHVSRLRSGSAMLVEGTVSAAGDGRGWNVETKFHAADPGEIRLDAAANVLAAAAPEVTLTRATGALAGVAVTLDGPARWRAGNQDLTSWTLDDVSIAIAESGHLAGRASKAGRQLHVEGEAGVVPLSLATLVEPTLDLEGTVDAKLSFDGETLAGATGALSLRGHGVVTGGLEAQGAEPVDLDVDARLARGRIAGTASLAGLSRTKLVVSLDAPLGFADGSQPFDAKLVMDGDVGEVLALLPIGEDTIAGNLDADLRVTGTTDRPDITGHAVLDGGKWENARSGLVMRDIHAELVGAGKSLTLQKFTATDGDSGSFTAAGRVRFGELPAFDAMMDLETRGAMLTRLDVLTTKGDVDLAVAASRTAQNADVQGTISGKISIEEARTEIPQKFVADIPQLEVIEVGRVVEEAVARARGVSKVVLDLDIGIEADNRVFVTGRGVESEWSADLQVRGDSSDPRLFGKVSSVRGHLSLLGRRFDVSSATLQFDGSKGNVPYLRLTARAEANDITAIAEVAGPATHPVLELRSDPDLPRDEVLSRVLFGQSAATLTPLQSVQLARSVAELTGSPLGGGGDLIGGIGRSLGFDRLDIESAGSDGAAALTASKYLTDDVYLRVQQGLTPDASKVSIEWRVLEHITIESDISQDAQGEVGVTWRWDY